jgi:hypothetical protein
MVTCLRREPENGEGLRQFLSTITERRKKLHFEEAKPQR